MELDGPKPQKASETETKSMAPMAFEASSRGFGWLGEGVGRETFCCYHLFPVPRLVPNFPSWHSKSKRFKARLIRSVRAALLCKHSWSTFVLGFSGLCRFCSYVGHGQWEIIVDFLYLAPYYLVRVQEHLCVLTHCRKELHTKSVWR